MKRGTIFLPQLLMSAEAAKAGVCGDKGTDRGERTGAGESAGTVLLATVKGDIHDIGKNIVKVLLEKLWFPRAGSGAGTWPRETIVKETVKGPCAGSGLKRLDDYGPCPRWKKPLSSSGKRLHGRGSWWGGAVLTVEYAAAIGADAYCKDAMASVNFCHEGS